MMTTFGITLNWFFTAGGKVIPTASMRIFAADIRMSRRIIGRGVTTSTRAIQINQFTEDLGPRRGTHLDLALVRDRAAAT
jgi:hypothetical protein